MKTSNFQPARIWVAVSMALASFVPGLAFADPPSQPGQPSGSINGSTVNLSWNASSDSGGVAGYNLYINNKYVTTVSGNSYSGAIDATQDNAIYVVAFDNQDGSGNRSFSARSAERQFSAQSVTTPSSNNGGNDNTGNSGGPIPLRQPRYAQCAHQIQPFP